jgi:pimeloyl-ACP methyl ester carboxylesterase
MIAPKSHFLEGTPRLHYLEWNPHGRRTVVLLHGNSANAWWWRPMVEAGKAELAGFRLLALDMRGHGDSGWVRPSAYSPADYAHDLARFIRKCAGRHPLVVGHSMGGIAVLAFGALYPHGACGVVAIDAALSSSERRDRFLYRLKALPTVTYPDLATGKTRFRLIPSEGGIAPEILAAIAEKSLGRTAEGGYTMKFDREAFIGSDGLDVLEAVRRVRAPLLLVRGGMSRVMTAEASERALESNPIARLAVIPGAHHHVLLEKPLALAREIVRFADSLDGA